jgi:hypothetical protein
MGQLLEHRQGGGSTDEAGGGVMVELRPRIEGHGGQLLSGGARFVGIEQLDQIGGRCRGSDPKQLQVESRE